MTVRETVINYVSMVQLFYLPDPRILHSSSSPYPKRGANRTWEVLPLTETNHEPLWVLFLLSQERTLLSRTIPRRMGGVVCVASTTH